MGKSCRFIPDEQRPVGGTICLKPNVALLAVLTLCHSEEKDGVQKLQSLASVSRCSVRLGAACNQKWGCQHVFYRLLCFFLKEAEEWNEQSWWINRKGSLSLVWKPQAGQRESKYCFCLSSPAIFDGGLTTTLIYVMSTMLRVLWSTQEAHC